MIYKFECKKEVLSNIEFQLLLDNLVITINEEGVPPVSVFLDKKDLYHLIGALHLIQKEIK